MFRKAKKKATPPKRFLDYLTKELMDDPVLVKINDEFKIVDANSAFLKDHKGVKVKDVPKLKSEIEEWKEKHPVQSIKSTKIEPEPIVEPTYVKIVLIGDSGVGKTQIYNRYIGKKPTTKGPTTNTDFTNLTKKIGDKSVKVGLYDIANNQYTDIQPYQWARGADVAVFVYDVNVAKTFDHIENYLEEMNPWLPENCIKILAGNKIDIEDRRCVSNKRAEVFAEENAMECIDISAKDDQNLDALFKPAIKKVLKKELEKQLIKNAAAEPIKKLMEKIRLELEEYKDHLVTERKKILEEAIIESLNHKIKSTKKDRYLDKNKKTVNIYMLKRAREDVETRVRGDEALDAFKKNFSLDDGSIKNSYRKHNGQSLDDKMKVVSDMIDLCKPKADPEQLFNHFNEKVKPIIEIRRNTSWIVKKIDALFKKLGFEPLRITGVQVSKNLHSYFKPKKTQPAQTESQKQELTVKRNSKS